MSTKKTRTNWEILVAGFRMADVKAIEVFLVMLGYGSYVFGEIIAVFSLRMLTNELLAHSQRVWLAAFWMVSAMFLTWVFMRAGFRALITFQARYLERVCNRAFERTLHRSHAYFLDEFAGRIVKRVTGLSKAFESLFDVVSRETPRIGMGLIGSLVFIALNQPYTALILGAVYSLGVFLLFKAVRWKQPIDKAKTAAASALVAKVADTVSNQQTVRLFDAQNHEVELFREASHDLAVKTKATWDTNDRIWGVQTFTTLMLSITALLLSIRSWQRGTVTAGDVVATFSYVGMMATQLNSLRQVMKQTFEALVEMEEGLELIEDAPEMMDHPKAKPLQTQEGSVAFKHVSFRYKGAENDLLRTLNLHIPGGQKIAFCGPSGAGKSTIFKLLLRLYDVGRGRIFIDDQPIRLVTQSSLWRSIALVPQDPALFHRSALENIRYGRRDATDTEVIEAAKLAHCHEFITKLPKGYNTLVGERGVKLSGGERQRIAIARAFLSGARILLLDEATSQLDSESESLIQASLKELMKGKTVIAIAHRLSTIKEMDRIVVMDGGKVIDEGKHHDLVRKNGLYARLWSLQAGEYQSPNMLS